MVKFDGLPVEIQEKMLEYQVSQGNPRDPDIFRADLTAAAPAFGFDWQMTSEDIYFWHQILFRSNIDKFYELYPKSITKKQALKNNLHIYNNNREWEQLRPVSSYAHLRHYVRLGKIKPKIIEVDE